MKFVSREQKTLAASLSSPGAAHRTIAPNRREATSYQRHPDQRSSCRVQDFIGLDGEGLKEITEDARIEDRNHLKRWCHHRRRAGRAQGLYRFPAREIS